MFEPQTPSMTYVMKYKDMLYSLLAEKVRGRKSVNILDIGCSYGVDLKYICKNHNNIKGFGMDMHLDRVVYSAGMLPGASFIQAMAQNIPFTANAFELVILSEVIEHISDVSAFLGEIRRILKKDGYIFITTPPRHAYTTLIGKIVPAKFKNSLRKLVYPDVNRLSGIRETLPDGTIVKEHVREYDPSELRKVLKENGFTVEVTKPGFLRVPIAPLFDRFTILLKLWGVFDALLSLIPSSIIFKSNYIVVARSIE